jgi:hypothetical protein
VVKEFAIHDALIQTPHVSQDFQNAKRLYEEFSVLLSDADRRRILGENAQNAMSANRGATARTLREIESLIRFRDPA